jgi:hypothetical protein
MQGLRVGRIHYLALIGALGALFALPAGASAARSATVTVPTDGVATATAECPEGKRATGGGFRTLPINTGGGAVYENRKVGQRRWRVSAENPGNPPFALTALAYCSNSASKTKQRQSPLVTNIFGSGTAVAECDSGDKARAGGFISADQAFTLSFFPDNSVRNNPRSWAVGNAVLGSPARYRSFAYCAGGGTPRARSGSVNAAPSSVNTALSAECPEGTKPRAGGFAQANVFGTFMFVNESFRVGDRWQTTAYNASGDPGTLTSVAYCS